tara:strand:+ start:25409 stop:26086 length:678 start_codon:yes stop_codon:yes gene_type:complete
MNMTNNHLQEAWASLPKSYYYISTGKGNVLYTLRYLEWKINSYGDFPTPYQATSHVVNLSTDKEEAIQKAKDYCKEYVYELKLGSITDDTNEWGTAGSEYFDKVAWEARQEETRILNSVREIQAIAFADIKDIFYDKVPSTDGERILFSGYVLGTKWVENDFGGTEKCLFQDNRGFKVWGNYGQRMSDATEEDGYLQFMAFCTPSDDDEYFGFINRPIQAKGRSK